MKKILTFIILGILVIATAIGAYLYNQNEIEIPDETVITAIKAQFPLEVKESVFSIGTIKLSHPNIRIENNEIIIETAYEFTNAEQAGSGFDRAVAITACRLKKTPATTGVFTGIAARTPSSGINAGCSEFPPSAIFPANGGKGFVPSGMVTGPPSGVNTGPV